jgi:FlaG/FlaF family flagellin (archaellin)
MEQINVTTVIIGAAVGSVIADVLMIAVVMIWRRILCDR